MSDHDVAELEARIAALERENTELTEELAQYREQNERDKAEMRRDVHDLVEVRTDDEGTDEDQAPTLEDVWIAGQPLGRIINGIQAKVNQEGARSDESATQNDSLGTPMEQLVRAGEAGVIGHVTARDKRAMEIAEHFQQWAQKAPNGLIIRDGLKKLLSTATGEQLAWSQVNRACEALQEATKGAIARKKTRKHGWILVAQPDDHRLRSLLAATS